MSQNFKDLDNIAFDAVIPSALLFNEKIEPNAIKLYGFVRGLTRAHGYCFATNAYLAHLMRCDESSVKRLLTSLKSEGFIEITTNKNGIHWQRHIYISEKFNKSLRRLKNKLPPAQNSAPPSSKMSPIYRDSINEIKEERGEGVKTPTASPPPNAPLFTFKRIKMSQEKVASLVKDFGEEKIKEMMERLDEYADINPKRFKQYACHAAVIRKWIRDDKEKNPRKSSVEENRKLAQKIVDKFPFSNPQMRFEALNTAFEYINHGKATILSYTELGFREQLLGLLRKIGLDVREL